jgi:hypothetical protein
MRDYDYQTKQLLFITFEIDKNFLINSLYLICHQNQNLQRLFFPNHLEILFHQKILLQLFLEQKAFCFAFYQMKIHYFKLDFL